MDTTMNRRSFVRCASTVAGALALGLSSAVAMAEEGPVEENPIEIIETVDCDVVVAGTGMAGACATVAAAEAGLNTVCLEKLGIPAGTTATAEGMFGVNSNAQKELGFPEEDLDEYFQNIENYGHWTNNPRICRRWLQAAPECMNWVMDHGVKIREVLASWSTVPTWHVYEGRGFTAVSTLLEKAEEAGATILYNMPATQLLMDEDGAVCGIVATDKDGKGHQYNCKAVAMCTGGFACNKEMIEELTGAQWYEDENTDLGYTSWKGSPQRMGDGILMGVGAGADTFRLSAVMADFNEVAGRRTAEEEPIRCIAGVVPVLWVNENAKRFTNEGLIDDFVAYGESASTQKLNYNIMDTDFIKRQAEGVIADCCGIVPKGTPFPNAIEIMDEAVEGDDFLVWKADTIEELAEQMGLDPTALKDTVDQYNQYCEDGYDPDFNKPADYLIPVKTAPFYGVKTIPVYMTTVGGLRVDERARVLNKEGKPMHGLYACGSDAGGLYGYSYDVNVAAGSQQSWCCVSARFAVEDMLQSVFGDGNGYVSAADDMAFTM